MSFGIPTAFQIQYPCMRVTPRGYLLLRKINVAAPGERAGPFNKEPSSGIFGRSLFRLCGSNGAHTLKRRFNFCCPHQHTHTHKITDDPTVQIQMPAPLDSHEDRSLNPCTRLKRIIAEPLFRPSCDLKSLSSLN
jgi:hypothetical protein